MDKRMIVAVLALFSIVLAFAAPMLAQDDAAIVKAVKAGNGMIYVMDRIPSSIGAMMEQMGMLPASSGPAGR